MTDIEAAMPPVKQELDRLGLRLLHMNNTSNPWNAGTRSWTAVYKVEGPFIYVSVTWLNPKDNYSRRIGARRAIDLFESGETFRVPRSKVVPADRILTGMFNVPVK